MNTSSSARCWAHLQAVSWIQDGLRPEGQAVQAGIVSGVRGLD